MKLKMDDAGHAVLQDGKPVYVSDDGRETAIDVAGTVATISRLNGEAKANRERAEAAERAVKSFDGIPDADAARKALATVQNLDEKKLIDSGDVDKANAARDKGWQDKLTAAETRAAATEAALYGEKIGGAFARSKFIADKSAIPADFLQSRFGHHFKVEDGQTAAYDATGNRIYSNAKPGELAGFEEAIEILVGAHPQRDTILKGNANGGSGARNNGGGTGAKTMTRAAHEAMQRTDPVAAMKAVTGENRVTLTD